MEMEGRAEQGQPKKGRVCSSLWLESCPAAGTGISMAGECISGVILKVAGVGLHAWAPVGQWFATGKVKMRNKDQNPRMLKSWKPYKVWDSAFALPTGVRRPWPDEALN